MPFKIINDAGGQAYELKEGQTLVIGRASTSDIPVFDPTISRRHAEVTASATAVKVKDLGSSNGTFINGAQIAEGAVNDGDIVMFGKVPFRVAFIEPVAAPPAPRASTAVPQRASGVAARPSSTILRELDVAKSSGPLSVIFRATSLAEVKAGVGGRIGRGPHGEAARAAARGLEGALARGGRRGAARPDHADRVRDHGCGSRGDRTRGRERRARAQDLARPERRGHAAKSVPQTIARKVAGEKVAVLSDNAGEDERFGGQSIVMQSVRSAMCAPLIGSGDEVLGVLYVDNVTANQKFGDDDLDFLIAFSNIAAVAIENSRFAERIRRETIVRSNFERFFAPTLAARIAGAGEQVKLGGEKRTIAILFSDIRGFTSLSETMNPDDVANLLSEYFTVMVEIVFRHGGTLDKFIGDAVMAQWGAPIGEKDDADRAMAAAVDMLEELKILNVKWKAAGRPRCRSGSA